MSIKDWRGTHKFLVNLAIKGIWIWLYTSLFLCALVFLGCASKPIVKIQEVLIPVKCDLEIPLKPQENGSFESHKTLAKYYLEVEQIAKDCTKNNN